MEPPKFVNWAMVRKARLAYGLAVAVIVVCSIPVFLAIDGYGMLAGINIHIPAFFVLRCILLAIADTLLIVFLREFFVDPYIRSISPAASYEELMERYAEDLARGYLDPK